VTEAGVERHFTASAYVVYGGRTLLHWHRKLRMWLPPGGHCEPNEDPAQAAVREAEEESGLAVDIIPPAGLLRLSEPGTPAVVAPPDVILVQDIRAEGQPFHQHIDHVYFTRPRRGVAVDFEAAVPGGVPHRWFAAAELGGAFSLPAPDGTLVRVAEDIRLLGIRAIAAAE
jgi:8-oxo-dGTP pyrophosphatase MutT (NUDIX family)